MDTTPTTATLRLVPRRRRPDRTISPSTSGRTVNITVRPDAKLLLSVEVAAERLDLGRTLLYELIAAGQIQTIHVGRLHEYTERRRASTSGTSTAPDDVG